MHPSYIMIDVSAAIRDERLRETAKRRRIREAIKANASEVSAVRLAIGRQLIRAGQAIAQIEQEAAVAGREATVGRAEVSLAR